jgi:hypothetical protein
MLYQEKSGNPDCGGSHLTRRGVGGQFLRERGHLLLLVLQRRRQVSVVAPQDRLLSSKPRDLFLQSLGPMLRFLKCFKMALFAQYSNFFKNLIITWFLRKSPLFRRKLSKIAENCDHYIDPR